ncbi:hypothetical protein [Turicibacter sp. TJ11]|uniref:hypothetical protein n=1 Tax=Turicibacter sp. TJ11 TaxID=2806443 RepID=UPI001F475F25|nr:hypothetical protein [Turicibacter sp. TJ11]
MEYGISGYQTDYRFEKKTVVELDSQLAYLTEDTVLDKVYLLGTKQGDHLIYTEITLVIENGKTGDRQFYPIPTSSGMGGGLDIGDFNHDKQQDIGVYILSGGTGNQVDYYLFFNEERKVQLGFSNRLFEEGLEYKVTYLPYYQVEVKNLKTDEETILNLTNKSADYLAAIYDDRGQLKQSLNGVVARVSDSNSINSKVHDEGHDLILTQRILGRSHNDTLGYVQSYISFDDGNYYVYRSLISQ